MLRKNPNELFFGQPNNMCAYIYIHLERERGKKMTMQMWPSANRWWIWIRVLRVLCIILLIFLWVQIILFKATEILNSRWDIDTIKDTEGMNHTIRQNTELKNHDVMPRDEIQRKGHNSCKEKTDRKKIIVKDVPA